MLVPFFFGWQKIKFYHISFVLLVLQFTFFFASNLPHKNKLEDLNTIVQNPRFYNETAYAYTQWIQDHPEEYQKSLHRISDLSRRGSDSYRRFLSSLAVRDAKFRRNVTSVEHTSNTLLLPEWENMWHKINMIETSMPLFSLGYKSGAPSMINLLTYQFMHSGVFHLMMNLFFFMLLAPLAERILGGGRFLILYIIGGVFSALTYSYLHPASLTPLVGASGSISFLLGFVSMYLMREKIYYFYWLLPKKGYFGFVKLSPIWAILLWFVADLSAELSAGVFDNIAHSAHLGGLILGLAIGHYYSLIHRRIGEYKFFIGSETTS